jgi:hypothetical protein
LVACSSPAPIAPIAAPRAARYPRIASVLGVDPIEADAADVVIAQADATERSLGMRARPLALSPRREDVEAHLRWYETAARDALRRLQAAECTGCNDREQAIYIALFAIEQDHLLGQLLAPAVHDPQGEAVAADLAAQLHRRLAAFVTAASSTPIGAALLALDICARRSPSVERIHAFCSERLRFWANIAGQANEDIEERAPEPTPDDLPSPPPEAE